MADLLLHLGAQVKCSHATGLATMMPSAPLPLVTVSGMQVATSADAFVIAGCAFTVATKPQPCVSIRWLVPALRVKVNGAPVLLQSSRAVCQSAEQAPQGPPLAAATQLRVRGT
jgi:hypothetical protein